MNHKHTYDEHDLCFECDKPKPKSRAEDMKRYRQRRKEAGKRVEFRAVCTPEEREELKKMLAWMRANPLRKNNSK